MAEESGEALYKKSYNLANEKMSAAADKMSADFEKARSEMEQEYLEIMASNAASLSKELFSINNEIR